jgi:FkbM family methyltransferase
MTTSENRGYTAEQLERLTRLQLAPTARETLEHAHLAELLEGCERFIDVGANSGPYMLLANRHLRGAEILGIEANPYLIEAARATCALAEAEAPHGNRFEVVHCAVSDSEEPIEFFVRDEPTEGSIFAAVGSSLKDKVRVTCRRLDSFYEPRKRTLIKMDIEGAEYRAMRSAERFLASDHTTFFLELHGWGDAAIHKYPLHVLNLFFEHGYACRRIGAHHVFHRAPAAQRIQSYLAAFPELFAVYRWAKGTVPFLRRVRSSLPLSRS